VLESSHNEKDSIMKEMESRLEEVRLAHSKHVNDLQGDIDSMSTEKNDLTQKIKDLIFIISEGKTSNQRGIQDIKSKLEAERSVHVSTVAEIQSMRAFELDQHQSISKKQVEIIENTRDEVKQLREEVDKTLMIKSVQEQQIKKLKDSVQDSSKEARRLGSTVTSEQATLAEVRHKMSCLEGENFQLKQSLQSFRSRVDEIATTLSSQEVDYSDLELLFKKGMKDKQHLEGKLSETMNGLKQLELTLSKVERERDALCVEVTRLQNDFHSSEKTHQDKEQELVNQIAALKKDDEIENLYRDLLGKMQDKEIHHSSNVHSMRKDFDLLKKEIKSLTEDKDKLTIVHKNIVAENEFLVEEKGRLALANECIFAEKSSLAENVACLERKLTEKDNDEFSTFTGVSMASHLKQTASELETTVRAIKRHHSDTVKKLQCELDDAHKRIKRYDRKVKDLTRLLEENALLIESFHKKLKGKKRSQLSSGTTSRPANSDESTMAD